MIKECCVCRKREQGGLWSWDFYLGEQQRVSHGYCPVCYEEFMTRLDQLFLLRHKRKFSAASTVQR